jgi:Protein of unknown function (DUF2442)
MTTSDLEQPDLVESVRCTDHDLVVALKDGRTISAPLWWYPRLLRATPEQRAQFEIGRFGIHWPEIDEDIELAGLLLGAKAPGAKPPSTWPYTIAITSVRFSGRAMRRLDQSEFLAVCVLGSALNDLGLLKRAMLASAHFPEATSVERNIGCSQFLFFARLHLSKIHEALAVIDRIWRDLATRYEHMLTREARKALKYLMTYKKTDKTLANVIRNKFEFHYPINCLRKPHLSEHLESFDHLTMYLHGARLNSFYFGSSMLAINCLLDELGYSMNETGLNKMIERFMDEGIDLDSKIHALAEDLLSCIFDRIDKEIESIQSECDRFEGAPISQLELPFFVRIESIEDEQF